MLHFNIPPVTGDEIKYIQQAIDLHKICGDGEFTKKCSSLLEEKFTKVNSQRNMGGGVQQNPINHIGDRRP